MATDVAVLGAGPAGAATAIALAALGPRVLLIDDPPRGPAWRVGELLPGTAREALEALGVADWLDGKRGLGEAQGIASSWGSEELVVTPAITNPYGAGWYVDRAQFERMLVDAARARGADVLRRARARVLERTVDGFQLEADAPTGRLHVRARYVVDATGRSRWAARRLGASRVESHDRQVAFAARLRAPRPRSLSPVLLLEACMMGWWYSVPVPRRGAVAAFVTDAELVRRGRQQPELLWRRFLESAEHTRERLAGLSIEAMRVAPAGTSRLLDPLGPGWAAVGDAAMGFDPLSSMGITTALETGLWVARSLVAAAPSPALVLPGYRSHCERAFAEYCTARRWFYARERRWEDSPFWRRRHSLPEASVSG